MRQNRVCPKCESRTFYTVEKARMADGQSINGTTYVALAAEYVAIEDEGGFFGPKRERIEGRIDAWICAACGFSELYARDLSKLQLLVEKGAEGVAFVDATPGSDGTFR